MKYRTIVADPPWEYPEGFAKGSSNGFVHTDLPYPSMTLRQIVELRVDILKVRHIAEDDARLFIWTTNRYLEDTFPIIRSWGFKYAQTLVWAKTNASPIGGSVAPIDAEYLLVCTRGAPPRNRTLGRIRHSCCSSRPLPETRRVPRPR